MDAKKLPCNQPRRDVQGGKKSVVRACKDGQSKVVRFGDAQAALDGLGLKLVAESASEGQ